MTAITMAASGSRFAPAATALPTRPPPWPSGCARARISRPSSFAIAAQRRRKRQAAARVDRPAVYFSSRKLLQDGGRGLRLSLRLGCRRALPAEIIPTEPVWIIPAKGARHLAPIDYYFQLHFALHAAR